MTATATLNGNACARVRMQVPAWGAWWADVDLTEGVELSGSVTLQLADVTAVGTVMSGGVADGRATYRIIGGAGGWGRTLPRKGYHNDAGIRLSAVVGDAAATVGESVDDLPTTRLGAHYVRREGMASLVLPMRAWHVGFDGVTRLTLRAESTYAGSAPRTRRAPGAQVIELAVEEIANLLPGVVVDDAAPATDVEYNLDAQRLTVSVWAGASTTRRLAALSAIFEALAPDLRYRGTYEFRVVTQEGDRLNLQPVRAATGMPDLARVPVRGAPGYRANVTLGELVLVTFVDADPSRPCVIAHSPWGDPGWMPQLVEIGDDPQFAAIAAHVDARLATIQSKFDTHVHSGVTTGVGSSAVTPQLIGALASVAATKTKVT